VVVVIEFVWDGWGSHSAVLGRAEGIAGYHDITRYPDSRQIPGLVLFRWANAELFKGVPSKCCRLIEVSASVFIATKQGGRS
jgi:hypothetical protein